jgi:hypothetical protein
MQKVPDDPRSNAGYQYRYCVSTVADKYQIYLALENTLDPQIITPNTTDTCTPDKGCINNKTDTCNYGVSSSNITSGE